jgi:hypothetical protein
MQASWGCASRPIVLDHFFSALKLALAFATTKRTSSLLYAAYCSCHLSRFMEHFSASKQAYTCEADGPAYACQTDGNALGKKKSRSRVDGRRKDLQS